MAHIKRLTNTRWYVGKGKNRKRATKDTAGAYSVTEKSENWFLMYADENGRPQKEKLSKYKEIATVEMGNFLRSLAERKAGLKTDRLEQVARPLSEHIGEWEATMKLRQIKPRRVVEVLKRVRKLVAKAEWERLPDISTDSVNEALAGLNVGAQTRNHYRQHIKQFMHWCVPDRILVNPLTKLRKENVAVDRRHDRQAISTKQATKLIRTTQASTRVYAVGRTNEMDGPTRAMLYDLAISTGLRREELCTLTRESFDLKKGILTVAAAYSKHRETDVLPMPSWLVERVRMYFEKGGKLWNNLTKHTSKMLCQDLKDAGIPYVVQGIDGPLFADFHSLRHTYVSAVCQTQGVTKDQMEMTRHRTADLFLKTYAKTTVENTRRIAAQLPDPLKIATDEQASAG